MLCVLHNLYGMDGRKAYFRKIGDCFDFVNRKEFASFLTWEEAKRVLQYKEWYCKQYGASYMDVEF